MTAILSSRCTVLVLARKSPLRKTGYAHRMHPWSSKISMLAGSSGVLTCIQNTVGNAPKERLWIPSNNFLGRK